SEIPFNLANNMKLAYSGQNVFFTLFLGCLGMMCVEYFRSDRPKLLFSLIALLAVSLLLKADYGITGFCFIMMMYALREQKILQAVVGCGILSSTWIAGLAFIPINLYNGERGFIKGRALQYCYYAIYPVHLLILYMIKRSMM
ncbi:MAG: TraX protein, partial [Firmicutes bacterium]|nr:TraX protein [Bacillota bacterium]